jgi:serine/threonine-protein kinase RIO1
MYGNSSEIKTMLVSDYMTKNDDVGDKKTKYVQIDEAINEALQRIDGEVLDIKFQPIYHATNQEYDHYALIIYRPNK